MLSRGLRACKRTLGSLVLIWFHLAPLTEFQIPNIIPLVLLWAGLAVLMIWKLVLHLVFPVFWEKNRAALTSHTTPQPSAGLQAGHPTFHVSALKRWKIQGLIEPICKYSYTESFLLRSEEQGSSLLGCGSMYNCFNWITSFTVLFTLKATRCQKNTIFTIC